MRVTAETKAETRQRIIDAAAKLFSSKGWENATTRDIAARAGIASGTLFNYFESKEAVVAELLSAALANAQQRLRRRPREVQSLEEDLFSLIWTELSSLRQFRRFLPAAAETIFSPLRGFSQGGPGESIRVKHLEAVEQIVKGHGVAAPLPAVALQLYWTLYLGVFAFWTADDSPNQEDTLPLLDQTLKHVVASLRQDEKREGSHERQSQ